MANTLLHFRNKGNKCFGFFTQNRIILCLNRIICRNINIYGKKRLIFLLKGDQKRRQSLDMCLQFQSLGINARIDISSAQFRQRPVNGPDGFCHIHGLTFHNHLCSREGHDSCEPCISDNGRIADNPEIVADHIIHDGLTRCKSHLFRHRPLKPVLGINPVDLLFIKVKGIRILQE